MYDSKSKGTNREEKQKAQPRTINGYARYCLFGFSYAQPKQMIHFEKYDKKALPSYTARKREIVNTDTSLLSK